MTNTQPFFLLQRLKSYNLYLRCYSKCRSCSGSTIHPSATLLGCLVCVSVTSQISFLFIQTLHNDCSHIEDVHLLFLCTFHEYFHIFIGLLNLDIFPSKMRRWYLVSHIEDEHLLFCAHLIKKKNLILRGVELRHFPSEMLRECLVCVICNSYSFHSFIFKLCIMIVHTLKMCASHTGPEQSLVLFF